MAGIFLWQQVAWAGGDISTVPVNNSENKSGYAQPQALQSAQAAIEGALAINQVAEDFKPDQTQSALAQSGLPIYEYDTLGRVIKTTYENGDFITISY